MWQTLVSKWFALISPSRLLFFERPRTPRCTYCSAGTVGSWYNACTPCQSKSVWSLVRGLIRKHGRLFGTRYCSCILAFHFFPSFTISCRIDPRVIVFHFVAFRRFSFYWFEEVVDFSFPSLSWSSHRSACLVSGAEAGVPYCCLLCPSFIW